MASDNEQLQPTPFDVAQPAPADDSRPAKQAQRDTPRWVLPALGGLLVLALLVIFWLPERVTPPAKDTTSTEAENAAADPAAATGSAGRTVAERKPDATPWSDAQAAKLRKEAQEVLAQLLDVQAILEERGVQQWAAEEFTAATGFATAGDELYRERQYEKAKARYEEGLAAMQALQELMPQELAARLEAARLAIEAGNLEEALAALDTATLIEPDSPELAKLRQRFELMPQLQTLLAQATAAEQAGDLAGAEQHLQQAAELDPDHQRAGNELQRVAAAHRQQRFNDAMSDGYAALDENRFDAARKAFRSAAGLQQGSTEAASALQEVAAAETAYRLGRLKQRGGDYEKQEKWQQAVTAYEQAQKIDANVLFASDGLQRARARARLDKQFSTALAEPQRLTDVAVAEATEVLLQQARRIQPRGPVLEQQITRLDRLLREYNTPVTVTLRSDQETEVIVYKVARLGRFDQRELTLRPGTYTAVGSRRGYRDVRREFTVGHDNAPEAITIACTEPI